MIGTGRRLVQKPSSSDGTKPVVCWGRERWNVGVCSRSVSQYRNTNKKKAAQSETSAARKNGVRQEDCQRSKQESPADSRRTIHWQEPWSTVPATADHLVLSGRNTREEGTGRGASRRRRPSKGARNEKTMWESELAVKLHGTLERWWRKIETCERSDLWAVYHRQGRQMRGHESGEGPCSQTLRVAEEKWDPMMNCGGPFMRDRFSTWKNSVLGVVKTELFVRLVHSKDYTSAAIGLCISSACKVLL